MIQKIKAADRFHIESDWLSAYWLFSFDRYYDPSNVNFGPLRVFNHDTIAPQSGFPTHSHREMEIVTYILEGELTHADSTGGRGLIHAGEVQRMTAGTGVAHSEINATKDSVRLLQMWVTPAKSGLLPSYEQKEFTPEDRAGRLFPIASGDKAGGAVHINQDATFYVSALKPGDSVEHALKVGRRAFVYLMEGEIELNGEKFEAGDQARVTDTEKIQIRGIKPSELILIDLP